MLRACICLLSFIRCYWLKAVRDPLILPDSVVRRQYRTGIIRRPSITPQYFSHSIFNTTYFGQHGRDSGIHLQNALWKMDCNMKIDSRIWSPSLQWKKCSLNAAVFSHVTHPVSYLAFIKVYPVWCYNIAASILVYKLWVLRWQQWRCIPFSLKVFHNCVPDDHLGDLGVDGWIILGRIFRRWDVGIWTGLGWPRIETGGRRLWVR